MLKAIFNVDINYPETPVFIYNQETGNFEHEDSFYHFAIVMNDPQWQVYATNGKLVYPIQNMNRAPEEDIFRLIHDEDDPTFQKLQEIMDMPKEERIKLLKTFWTEEELEEMDRLAEGLEEKDMFEPNYAVAPAETFLEVLQDKNLTIESFSKASGIDLNTLKAIVDNTGPITQPVADALQKETGVASSFWMNLEKNYRARLKKLASKSSDSFE